MKESIIAGKSFKFSLRLIKLYKYLVETKREFVLSRQVLKSGTAIGANIEETLGAQSNKDFISKISIAYKEARETHYWIRLLRDTDYITEKQADSLIRDCEELIKIITKIQITMKKTNN